MSMDGKQEGEVFATSLPQYLSLVTGSQHYISNLILMIILIQYLLQCIDALSFKIYKIHLF